MKGEKYDVLRTRFIRSKMRGEKRRDREFKEFKEFKEIKEGAIDI